MTETLRGQWDSDRHQTSVRGQTLNTDSDRQPSLAAMSPSTMREFRHRAILHCSRHLTPTLPFVSFHVFLEYFLRFI